MAEGNVVDAASVKISPDTSRFREELRAELSKIREHVTVDVDVDLNTDRASAALKAWRERESGKTIEQKVRVDSRGLDKVLGLLRGVGALSIGAAAAVSIADALAGVVSVGAAAVGVVNILPGALAAAAVAAGTLALGAEGIKRAFESAKGPAEDLKKAVEDTFAGAMEHSGRRIARLLPQLQDGFTDVALAISSSANHLTSMLLERRNVATLNSLLDRSAGITQNFGKALAPVVEGLLHISDIGAGIFEEMTRGAGNAAVKFRDWVRSAEGTKQIEEWIRNGVDALRDIWKVGADVVGIFRAIGQAFENAGMALGSTFGKAIADVREALESVEGQDQLTKLAESLINMSDTVRDVFLTAVREIGPVVIAALPGIAELARQIGEVLKAALEVVGPPLKAVFGFLSDNMNRIGPVVLALTGMAVAIRVVTTAVTALRAAFIALSLSNPFTAILLALTTIVTYIVMNWEHVTTFLTNTWNWIKETASTIWNAISSFFSNLMTGISTMFTASWQSIGDFLSGIWNWVSDTASTIWNGIKDTITSILSGIADFFSTAWDKIVSFVVGAWERIKNGVTNGIRAVVNFMKELPGKIVDAVGDLSKLLWNAGKAIVQGLWEGIKSMIDWLWGKVKGFIGGLVDGVTSMLGIHSPSRVFADIGRDTMRGMAVGIDANAGKAVASARDAAREVTKAASDINAPSAELFNWNSLTDGLSSALKSCTQMVKEAVNDIASTVNNTSMSPGVGFSGTNAYRGMVGVSRIDGYLAGQRSLVRANSVTTTTYNGSSFDYDRMAEAMTSAMNGVRVEMDANGILRIVEKARVRKERRR